MTVEVVPGALISMLQNPPCERLGCARQCGEVRGVADLARGMIVELRRKRCDSGKSRAIQRVDPARGLNRGFGGKSAFVAAIERIALGSARARGSPVRGQTACAAVAASSAFSSENTVQ